MENTYQIEADLLAVSLTKPAKQFGVPLVLFYFNCMITFLLCMLVSSLVQQGIGTFIIFFLIFLIAHLIMVWITFKDDFGLRIFWINKTQFEKHNHFELWNNTDSFSP